MAIYAIGWQQVIKKVDISIAYMNKSVAIVWSLLWSILFFREQITLNNVIGVVVILTGVVLMNTDRRDQK